jgi:hypothetical protein
MEYLLAGKGIPKMTLQEIKTAVEAGKTVYVGNRNYKVVHDNIGQWLIVCTVNNYTIGLTWADGKTLNSAPDNFFTDTVKSRYKVVFFDKDKDSRITFEIEADSRNKAVTQAILQLSHDHNPVGSAVLDRWANGKVEMDVHDVQQISAYEDEILNLIDNRDEFSRSDLQGIVSALVLKIAAGTVTKIGGRKRYE